MRFLHLADLHLGKRLNDIDLLADQEDVLKQALELRTDYDAVMICGDVYDRSAPSAEAMALFDRFITALVEADKLVFIIAGNHDSNQRLAYFSKLLKNNKVFISDIFKGTLQSYTVNDEYGIVNVHMLPFVRIHEIKKYYPDEIINSYEDAIRVVLKNSPINKNERNILLAHQFISGCEQSDSEESSIGTLDNVSSSLFDDFDYVALGHIHKPQRIKRDSLRYAGSIYKYSFSESNQHKSFCLVDFVKKDVINILLKDIIFKHDVVSYEGYFDDLIRKDFSLDYIRIILHDEEVYPDYYYRLLHNFPNMLKYAVVNSKTRLDIDVRLEEGFESKSTIDLFKDFYRLQNNDVEASEQQLQLLEKILKKMEVDE